MAMNAEAEAFVPTVDDDKKDGKGEDAAADANDEDSHTGGMSGTRLWRPQYQGRIRSYSQQKGFGFIDCTESLRAFGRDVFIHRFQMEQGGLSIGQEVTFEVELNRSGCPQARNVQFANADQAERWGGMGMGMDFGSQSSMYGCMGGKGCGCWNGPGGGWGAQGKGGCSGSAKQGQPDQVEEMLKNCQGSARMWEIIEQHGHSFNKKHVVTALYQLGLCRQYEKRNLQANLTTALVDCLVLYDPREFSPDEASRVVWALATLEELHDNDQTRRYAMKLGEEAARRCHEFTPDKMTKLVSSLSRLVKGPDEDELVGRLTTSFSDYALGQDGNGSGSMPRFPPEELNTWMSFLKEASGAGSGGGMGGGMPQQAKGGPFPGGPGMKGGMPGGMSGMFPPGGYNPQMGPGPGPPWGKGGPGMCGPMGMPGPGMPPGGMGPGPCGYGMQGKGGGFGNPGSYSVGPGGMPGPCGPRMNMGPGGPGPGGFPGKGDGKGMDMKGGFMGGPMGGKGDMKGGPCGGPRKGDMKGGPGGGPGKGDMKGGPCGGPGKGDMKGGPCGGPGKGDMKGGPCGGPGPSGMGPGGFKGGKGPGPGPGPGPQSGPPGGCGGPGPGGPSGGGPPVGGGGCPPGDQ